MVKKFLLIYLLIGFFGYTLFKTKEPKILDITSINGQVTSEVKEVLTMEVIKANVLIHASSYQDIIGIKLKEIKQIGSGVIIDERDGYYFLLTNAHVISFRYELSKFRYKIFDYQGNSYQASLIELSLEDDLALLKFKKSRELKVISLSKDMVKSHDIIYAIGNPKDVSNCISVGEVNSFTKIAYTDYEVINHSAEIDSGNSGGMLINESYELIGINTWAYFDKSGNYKSSLAIPNDIIYKFLGLRH